MVKRILVVDDDLHSREGLRASLQGEGYLVETASDSWEAIKTIKESRFDVAIIDLDLPPVHGVTMSGWDLARIFRAYHPAISIIVVSAVDRNTARVEAERLSVSEVLEKPINPTQLKGIVRSLNSLSEGHPTGGSN
ncbi:MAG TPA: response regulator [Candidatus Methylomirabilis sp.]|nr:response regulator [Candidatus Methylomirabilis sp.]